MVLQHARRAARQRPERDEAIIARRGKSAAIRAEGDTIHRVAVAAQRTHQAALCHVPELDLAELPRRPAGRRQQTPIRTECQESDRAGGGAQDEGMRDEG